MQVFSKRRSGIYGSQDDDEDDISPPVKTGPQKKTLDQSDLAQERRVSEMKASLHVLSDLKDLKQSLVLEDGGEANARQQEMLQKLQLKEKELRELQRDIAHLKQIILEQKEVIEEYRQKVLLRDQQMKDMIDGYCKDVIGMKEMAHRIQQGGDLEGAVEVVLATARRYRLPEPSRLAHDYVNDLRRAAKGG